MQFGKPLLRSQLHRLTSGDDFLWATGIEDTFIADPWPKSGRILDEYELTGHYTYWSEDIDRIASLGVRYARYGIPWYKINPAPGEWDWSFPDKALGKLLDKGVHPIVDLIHYGAPAWLEGAFTNEQYPEAAAEYARRVAERYKGKIYWYTPLNEPRITAWYSGKLGWWPPYLRGWKGFLSVLAGVCRGIVLTSKRLYEVDPEIVQVHVDATDLFFAEDTTLQEEAERRQDIVFLALDLISGTVDEAHPLRAWLLRHGVSETVLHWFEENAIELDLVGLNLYPMFSRKVLARKDRKLRISMPYADAGIVGDLCRMYYDRYEVPLMIAETASVGSVARRHKWLNESVNQVIDSRLRGIPVVGYTWWPMLALVTWAYRQQGLHDLSHYILQMGLWDFDRQGDDPIRRLETPLIEAYRSLVESDLNRIGEIRR